ncbi:hypothetical protein ACC740_38270, partial [Rhizobium ruizarguesonis]
ADLKQELPGERIEEPVALDQHVVRRTIPQHPLLLTAAAGYVILSFIWVTGHLWIFGNSLAALGLPPVITCFSPPFLSLPL